MTWDRFAHWPERHPIRAIPLTAVLAFALSMATYHGLGPTLRMTVIATGVWILVAFRLGYVGWRRHLA
jgi:hypothetical protein